MAVTINAPGTHQADPIGHLRPITVRCIFCKRDVDKADATQMVERKGTYYSCAACAPAFIEWAEKTGRRS